MSVYIYIYIYACISIYIHVCISLNIYLYVNISLYAYFLHQVHSHVLAILNSAVMNKGWGKWGYLFKIRVLLPSDIYPDVELLVCIVVQLYSRSDN